MMDDNETVAQLLNLLGYPDDITLLEKLNLIDPGKESQLSNNLRFEVLSRRYETDTYIQLINDYTSTGNYDSISAGGIIDK